MQLFFVITNLIFVVKIFAQSTQTFLSNGIFIAPAGVTSITVQAWGSGAGGGIAGNTFNNAGGGGGAYASSVLTVVPGNSYAVTVGAASTAGVNGSNSNFASLVIASGGSKPSGINDEIGGSGGLITACIGTIKFAGGNGGNSTSNNNEGGGGGGGSATSIANGNDGSINSGATGGAGGTGQGNGGNGGDNYFNGNNGNLPGAGGGGKGSGVSTNSGSGAGGEVMVSWNCPTYNLLNTSASTPICIGNTSTIMLTSSAVSLPIGIYSVTYDLSGANSSTGNNAVMTVAVAGSGSFTTNVLSNPGSTTLTITNLSSGSGSGCSNAIINNNSSIIAVGATGYWLGITNTNWNTTSNWCGVIPTSTTDVFIPSGVPNMPNINAAGAVCRNLNINNGATMTITGTNNLTVNGNWVNNGNFIANNCTIIFNAASGIQTVASGNSSFYAITHSGAGTLQILNDALTTTNSFNNSGGGTVDLNALAFTVGDLQGNGIINSNIPGAVTITNGSDNLNSTFSGSIQNGNGIISLTKIGTDTLIISGINTFTGLTTVSNGTLGLGGVANQNTLTGDILINGGTLMYSKPNDSQIADGSNITLTSGIFNPAARTDTIASLTMTGGALTKGGNTLTLKNVSSITGGTLTLSSATASIETLGNLTLGAATFDYNSTSTGNSNLNLGGDVFYAASNIGPTIFTNLKSGVGDIRLGSGITRTFNIAQASPAFGQPEVQIEWMISQGYNPVVLFKSGTGTLQLSGANTFSGGTTLNDGQININHDSAIGKGTFIIEAGKIDNTSGNAITLSKNNPQSWNGDFTFIGSNSLNLGAGLISMSSSRQVTINSNTLTIGGTLNAGCCNLTKSGNGTLSFVNQNITLNDLNIGNGALTASSGSMNILGNYLNNGIFFHNSGTVNFNGTNQSIAGTASTTFNNLTSSGSGTKTLGINTSINGILNLNSSTVLSIAANTLTLNGTLTGTGTLKGLSASNLTIGGSGSFGALYFDQSNYGSSNVLNNIIVNRSSGILILGSNLIILNSYTPTNALLTISSGDTLILRSTISNTAAVNQGSSTGNYISGNVLVERYIPNSGRRYRLLTPTVTTNTSINANWQEGQTNTSTDTTQYQNNHPGYGTQITGTGASANGFDITQTNQSSLFLCSNNFPANQVYTAIANTNVKTLNSYTGYFLFVRGDRSMNMNLPNTNVPPLPIPLPSSSTTLRATGSLVEGDITGSAFGSLGSGLGFMNLITNPYPSEIDWYLVYADCNNISSSYQLWDASIGYRGGFVAISTIGVVNPPGTTTNATRYIQPGQAFFVQSSNSSAPVINIKESHKVSGHNNNGIFTVQAPVPTCSASLYFTEGSGFRRLADGVTVVYDSSYSSAVDADDAVETPNWDENIAINRQGNHLAIEARPVIVVQDTLPLFMNHMNQMSYEYEFTCSNFNNPSVQATLIDNYTGVQTSLNVNGTTVVPFTINSVAASGAGDRFMVIFGSAGSPLPVRFSSVNASEKNQGIQIEWIIETEQSIADYEVEKSAEGLNFSKLGTVASLGNSNQAIKYEWFDGNPYSGNNFYRIKSIDKSGGIGYSNIVNININKINPAIIICPNPVKGNSFNLQLNNLAKGNYAISLFSNFGQCLFSTRIKHDGSSVKKIIEFKNNLANGFYQLKITGGGVKMTTGFIKI